MKRIAVTAPRGGVGKTFVACNLAFYLQQSRMRVSPCVIDFGAHVPASKYLDQTAYQSARGLHHDDFAFKTSSGLFVACCEDWDKAEEGTKREAFKDIMADPLAQSRILDRTLLQRELLKECDTFVYDTDHFIKTFIRFLGSFERIILLFDENDDIGMQNLAESWIHYSNFQLGQLVRKRPRKTFILANRTSDHHKAKGRLLKCCGKVFSRLHSAIDAARNLTEIEEFCVDFSIPKFRDASARRSFNQSIPIWDIVPDAKDSFRFLAALL